MIRVEVDPDRARAELDRVLDKAELPRYVADQITAWRASLKSWAKEPRRIVRTPADVFKQVAARFKKSFGRPAVRKRSRRRRRIPEVHRDLAQ